MFEVVNQLAITQGFGAAFGIPLQGQTTPQGMSSQQQADGQKNVQGTSAAAARKVAMQTNSMKEDTAQPSGRSSPASMITLPASKTAKGQIVIFFASNV